MLEADDFESAFRSADKRHFHVQRPVIESVLILTDLDGEDLENFEASCREFLAVLGNSIRWKLLGSADHSDISEALGHIENFQPDLVCTYRNINTEAWKWPFSLGAYVNVLTRATQIPILILPNPKEIEASQWQSSNTDSVLVVTDHLAGDDAMVNWGARLTRKSGELHLAHVEDEAVFDRYIKAISKIEGIQTEFAERAIRAQLLKEPSEYAQTCADTLGESGHGFEVKSHTQFGGSLEHYERLIADHHVDLLILRATEAGQLAMHGASYLLAVQHRRVPVLML